MLRVSQPAALALASAAAAAAPAPCPEKDRGTLEEWKCFGEVHFTSQTEGEDSVGARFVVFANEERLYEKRAAAANKAVLMGAGWSPYRGLTREDSTVVGAHHPLATGLLALSVKGRWSSETVRPYADSLALEGWQYHCAPTGPLAERNL